MTFEIPPQRASGGEKGQTALQFRGTPLIRNSPLLGPYSKTMPMVVLGGGLFLLSEVLLYALSSPSTIELFGTQQNSENQNLVLALR